ncbi:MAG: alpha/beta hydrolase [Smithellaceae bacterium]
MMNEKQVYINNNELMIEGLLNKSSEDRGVVICHPHSLMGGSMHNNVVEAIQEAFTAEKYATLRFNFRGVGRSTGFYDEGIGEQEDIFAVCNYLRSIGILKISFAGYSFGSWVGSKVMERDDHPFVSAIFISPPISYFDFYFNKLSCKINMIISGDNDQFCNINALKEQIKNINSTLKIITNTDHFYFGREEELINILRASLNNQKK